MSGRRINLEEDICRLCLSDKTDHLKRVFDDALSSNFLQHKIALLLQIQVSKFDQISTMVCNDCIIRLDTWFAYKKQCHKNQTKLTEWLNISKSNGIELHEAVLNIKTESLDPFESGLPVKVEVTCENDEYTSTDVSAYQYDNDIDLSVVETDDDRRCSDCGKMFGSSQNRRRHQNMMHLKKERRFQMAEIKKAKPKLITPIEIPKRLDADSIQKIEKKPEELNGNTTSSCDVTSHRKDECNSETNKFEEADTEIPILTRVEETTALLIPGGDSLESSAESANIDEGPPILERNVIQSEEKYNVEQKQSEPQTKPEKTNPANETKLEEKLMKFEEDEKKIEFAAGLKLIQKDSTPNEFHNLSKIEISYLEKCKAMVSMFQTLQCACHDVQHKTMRNLLSHLRETRIWFPLFTCYNCMISLTDRSTFTKHHSRCPQPQLDALKKLSNLRKRSQLKSRLYQNFKCNRCKFLFSFHEDFCKHVNDYHARGSPPFYCSCRFVFNSLEEYKTHCYTSCTVSYYCDICFKTTSTIEEFIKHAEEEHDSSEGFVLLQDNTYVPRSQAFRHKEADDEANVLEGKRERKKSCKEPVVVHIYDKEIPADVKDIPTSAIRRMLELDGSVNLSSNSKAPSKCPVCRKQYSSVNNMMRHYRTHIEKKEVEIPKIENEAENEDLYTCPDCGGVYPASKWKDHLKEKHSLKACSECDKEFQFQNELDQHRSVHLNIKVFRDSKTQVYRSAMLSPTEESAEPAESDMITCTMCDDLFNNKDDLKRHKMLQHDSSTLSAASSSMENVSELEPLLEVTELNEEFNNKATSDQLFCDPCDREFASPKSLREHVLNKHGASFLKNVEYPKTCKLCGKSCTTGSAYKIHMQMHNRMNLSRTDKLKDDFPKKCEYCDKMCNSGAGLYVHTQMHERVTLGELKKKKVDKKKVDLLEEPDAEESYHTCNRCFKVFATKGRLKEHLKSHSLSKASTKRNRKVLCDLCHLALDSHADLKKHKSEEHSDELPDELSAASEMDMDESTMDTISAVMYACDNCEDSFSSRAELKSHKEIHTKSRSKTLICKYCKTYFSSVNELTKHMNLEHDESFKHKVKVKDSEKLFACSICKKTFSTYGAMTAHSGWHKRSGNRGVQELPLNSVAAKSAARLAKRQTALRKIEAAKEIKPEPIEVPEFQCSTCLVELPNETALQIHVLEKHGNLDALMLVPRCDICNKDFATQDEYETHKRFHDFLERQRQHERQLKTPIIQSVETVVETPAESTSKRVFCSWCSSSFSRQDTLNTHIKHHHKEHVKTEFECNQCNRIFDKQSSLTIHLKMHQKQKTSTVQFPSQSVGKTYVCSLCNKCFNYPKDLRMHTINAHPF
ncbi:zinc finger protein 91 isoform X2 [Dendroctonus ponderosae]|uniref:Uncharacterized protein n=1 Tax=Dendroctonus ponderosae TaxID=77166 RepID=A0AAR5QAA1_DENPD|nr:zinc finger protein 91 isoform X2 [Dendroctonus ponderosae]